MSRRLTAEQVRELIAPHLRARPTFDFGHHGAVWKADFQAIADELNATLGGGECEIAHRNGDWYCTGCNEMVGSDDPWNELFVNGNAIELWGYCPVCGRKVKR